MKRRNILIGLFYVFITLGIYAVYWYFSLLNGFAKETGRKDKIGWRVLGLGIITAGLYIIYYSYKMGDIVTQLNAHKNEGLAYALLTLSIVGILAVILMWQLEANMYLRNQHGAKILAARSALAAGS